MSSAPKPLFNTRCGALRRTQTGAAAKALHAMIAGIEASLQMHGLRHGDHLLAGEGLDP